MASQSILPFVLGLMMLAMGLSLSKSDFTRLWQQPKVVAIGLSLQLLLLPPVAMVIAELFQLSDIASAGLFLVALCPGGASSNLLSFLAKGNLALSISLTALTSLIVPFSLPLLFTLYLAVIGQTQSSFDLPLLLMTKQLVVVTLLPVVVGMLLRQLLLTKIDRVLVIVKWTAALALFAVVTMLVVEHWKTVIGMFSSSGVAVISFSTILFFIAYFVATKTMKSTADIRTVTIEVGVQNAGTAMLVALSLIGNAQLATVPLMYGLLMNIPAFIFVMGCWYQSRR
ncbi:bile acid:sodium symporter family protein [Endozoicomonas sp. G2_1]|uniref:bile acid:sodium symporter family protein n=1 Tax=Endozoicomonas sp. G2_1 TaxID=2821091 RepID=UPI001B27FC6F|nr:bile acid:sodium symporter [Endozoicomonas sp. G2_1]MBO9492386.1 bile acid:sodium symporter family protein [Endozoicomonas sp. G2_1]